MAVEITEEMVERARLAAQRMIVANDRNLAEQMRHALNAALNPPPEPEPEIVVTEEMVAAGELASRQWGFVAAVYRAMRRLEPKADPTSLWQPTD